AQLESALLNAAFNARDAMPEGGRITLCTENREGGGTDGTDAVAIALRDTGQGMSPDVLTRAFEPFFTTKPVGKGTGLGLSQIHGFAAQSGGRAEVESVEGEGTTIRLILPRSDKLPAQHRAAESEGEAPAGLKVLLVEDNDHVREFATALLEDLHYKVLSAEGGEEALALLEREEVDLLFSDVVMPGMSGIDLARAAREAHPGLPVLLASGYSEAVIEGAAAPFEFLNKPYDPTMLATAIAAAMKRAGATADA
ncbi:MAG: response regulator, partial [Alphaproteobacteria bacterium]